MSDSRRYLALALALATIVGCVSATYKPPDVGNQKENYTRLVNKTFDATWDALIQYSAKTFFAIDNFERASGLLTLSFGAENPGTFVDGGYWKYSGMDAQFEGNYIDFLAKHRGGSLTGRMNVVVKARRGGRQTVVTVHTRYVFTATVTVQGRSTTDTWSFDSGGSAEVAVNNPAPGTPPTRTLRPTYKAEKAILQAIERLK